MISINKRYAAASQLDDHGVELPANAKGEAAGRVVDKLIRAGLLEEVGAGGSLPVWRRDDSGGAMALRITKTGLAAIDAADEATAAPEETSVRSASTREIATPAPEAIASRTRISVAARKSAGTRHGPGTAKTKTGSRRESRPGSNKLGCSRCWADQRERRLLPSCARPIGSSIRSAASSPVWCARSSASISARRRSTATGSISCPAWRRSFQFPPLARSRSLSVMPRVVIDPAVPESEALNHEIARRGSRCRGPASQMAYGVAAAISCDPLCRSRAAPCRRPTAPCAWRRQSCRGCARK